MCAWGGMFWESPWRTKWGGEVTWAQLLVGEKNWKYRDHHIGGYSLALRVGQGSIVDVDEGPILSVSWVFLCGWRWYVVCPCLGCHPSNPGSILVKFWSLWKLWIHIYVSFNILSLVAFSISVVFISTKAYTRYKTLGQLFSVLNLYILVVHFDRPLCDVLLFCAVTKSGFSVHSSSPKTVIS